MLLRLARALLVASASTAFAASTSTAVRRTPCPSLGVVENTLLTTAKSDFGGHSNAFEEAAAWNGKRLRTSTTERGQDLEQPRAPHLCCTDYEHGREAYSFLQDLLCPEAVRLVVHSEEHGACFFATASQSDAAKIAEHEDSEQAQLGLSFAPFPSALKIAPGLLEHGHSNGPGRLSARHGALMRMDNVEGLSVELAPGTLPAHTRHGGLYIKDLLDDLMSESRDLHATNFWSDPAMAEGEHLATPEGAVRGQDWSKAAAVVHGLSEAASTSPGDICSWNTVRVLHAGDDLLLVGQRLMVAHVFRAMAY